jgi:hypothetical protein
MDMFIIPADKIRVIELNREERKAFHNFVETNYPKLKKTSLICHKFNFTCDYFASCYKYPCKNKRVLLTKYHYGQEKNNEDQWMSGTCPKCNKIITEDCIDNNIIAVQKNNAVAFGNYFKGYKNKDKKNKDIVYEERSEEGIVEILRCKKVYEIDAPTTILNKNDLQEYISNKI